MESHDFAFEDTFRFRKVYILVLTLVTRDGSKSKLKLRDVGAFIENQKTQKHPFFDEYEVSFYYSID